MRLQIYYLQVFTFYVVFCINLAKLFCFIVNIFIYVILKWKFVSLRVCKK